MGLAKAFDLGSITQLSKDISRPIGILWSVTGLVFILSAFFFMMKKDGWAIASLIAVVLSQILIFTVWEDTKFGTIANLIILVAAIVGLATFHFENGYKRVVLSAMKKTTFDTDVIAEKDLIRLPPPVQRYLRYVGVVGQPKVQNVRIVFEGEMRDKGKDWFPFTSEQYNFFESSKRFFFMKAKVNGLPTYGYHAYNEEGASMLVKVLSLFSVVDMHGNEMFPTETVTFFNDMCLFAPAALIDDRIQWETMDDLTAKATLTVNGASISAVLYFNEKGQLVNFVSHDRYAVAEMKTLPFSTPAKNYKSVNGYNLATYGESIWQYPDGEFVYGKFHVNDIEYNVSDLR
jgi:hypothetical protein